MQIFFETILTATIFLSLIPVIHMLKDRGDQKYLCLKFLILSTFFWSILITFERFSTEPLIIYYAGMMGFVLRLLFAMLMLCTIFQYVNKRFPKVLFIIFTILLSIDLLIALTNARTQWFLELKPSELSSFNELYTSSYGSLFIYHLILSYVIALSAIILLFMFLRKQKGVRQYKEVTYTMAIAVVVVLSFNAIQIFNRNININLTYVSLVLVAFALYDVIFRKDMVFNLRASGRTEILTNMRELYILTDSKRKIIEVSPLLLEKYHLSIDEIIGEPFSVLEEKLAHQVSLYSDYQMNEDDYENKDHYHLREKEFKLKRVNESGHMVLLYDETQVYLLLRELNQLSNYDAMTGLNNRNYIENKIKLMNDTKQLGILSLDLNGLKINNDYLGHERGDFLLKSLANIIKATFKDISKKDIGRIGGDEFIIIMYETDKLTLKKKIDELLKACNKKSIEDTISVSIGSAYDLEGTMNIYTLIQHADKNMYEMKEKTSKAYKEELMEYIKLSNRYIR